MTTTVTAGGEATVLTVTGEVDLATAPALETAIDATLADNPANLIIDLARVTFLASAGMAALVAAYRRAGERTRIAIVAEGPATSRQLKITNLDQVFELHSSLDAALAAISGR
ncbi:anti-sigma factor antagonist [Nocardia stercoris]|uniref:Anti-sigma factor antagonist n=2 Tax=Nocardia stercoris TaxID=2483361 RepID=A0A3M2LCJ2_9NOCA|nr:anti-sigma factor antagonist [Nocardia stercoris]